MRKHAINTLLLLVTFFLIACDSYNEDEEQLEYLDGKGETTASNADLPYYLPWKIKSVRNGGGTTSASPGVPHEVRFFVKLEDSFNPNDEYQHKIFVLYDAKTHQPESCMVKYYTDDNRYSMTKPQIDFLLAGLENIGYKSFNNVFEECMMVLYGDTQSASKSGANSQTTPGANIQTIPKIVDARGEPGCIQRTDSQGTYWDISLTNPKLDNAYITGFQFTEVDDWKIIANATLNNNTQVIVWIEITNKNNTLLFSLKKPKIIDGLQLVIEPRYGDLPQLSITELTFILHELSRNGYNESGFAKRINLKIMEYCKNHEVKLT
jgi:hypothetical protein